MIIFGCGRLASTTLALASVPSLHVLGRDLELALLISFVEAPVEDHRVVRKFERLEVGKEDP